MFRETFKAPPPDAQKAYDAILAYAPKRPIVKGGVAPAPLDDFDLEVLDVTFTVNLDWAPSAEDCARRAIYHPLHALPLQPDLSSDARRR